jgi:cell division septal protein FtsQ
MSDFVFANVWQNQAIFANVWQIHWPRAGCILPMLGKSAPILPNIGKMQKTPRQPGLRTRAPCGKVSLHVTRPLQIPSPRRRAKRNRRLLAAGLVLLLAAFAASTPFLLRVLYRAAFRENPFFTIRTVSVSTDGDMPEELVCEYAGVAVGGNLFAVSPASVRRALENVSSVSSASVRRILPGTLSITVRERKAVATLSPVLAVDATGTVLGPRSVRPRLPRLSGLSDAGLLPGSRIADRAFPVMLDILAAASDPALGLPSPVREIVRAENPPFTLLLADGTRILLSGEDVRGKLRWFPRLAENAEKRGMHFTEYDLTPSRNYAARAVPREPAPPSSLPQPSPPAP